MKTRIDKSYFLSFKELQQRLKLKEKIIAIEVGWDNDIILEDYSEKYGIKIYIKGKGE